MTETADPATAYGPHQFTILELGDRTTAPHCAVCGFEEDDGRAEHVDEPSAGLPGPARLALRGGELDVDAMRAQAPVVRQALLDALRHSATLVREARGTVVAPEDTYDLVRRVTAAEEVCRQWAQAFTDAAKEAAAIAEEEALTAMGEQDGVPNGSLFVPDGEGQRIAIRADWDRPDQSWDLDSLAGWLAEDTVTEQGVGTDTDRPVFTAQEVVALVRDGLHRLLALGGFSPRVTAIEALRKKLAGKQRDADAAVIGQLRTVGPRRYKGVKITREEA